MNQVQEQLHMPKTAILDRQEDLLDANAYYEYLQHINDDLRGEIKMRITQRDTFSSQFIVGVLAVIALAYSELAIPQLLLLVPLITIFFSAQILYSYTLHNAIVNYLAGEIEPRMRQLFAGQWADMPLGWEEYHCMAIQGKRKFPGIRQNFFLVSLWVSVVLSDALLCATLIAWHGGIDPLTQTLVWATTPVYLLINLILTCNYYKENRRAPLG